MNAAIKKIGTVQAPSVADFAKGQRDCRDDKQAKAGASKDYNNGYGVQYEIEQRQSEGGFN